MSLDLDPSGPDLARAQARDASRGPAGTPDAPTVRGALSEGFDALYGPEARQAEAAFGAAAGEHGLAAASRALADRPEAFGALDGPRADAAFAVALGGALAGAPGHTPGLAARQPEPADDRTRQPDMFNRIMTLLYDANESTAGTVVGAAGSFIPGVDTVLDVADVGLNVWRVSQPHYRDNPQAWINLGTTAVGVAIPLAGDSVEAALKAVLRGGGEAAQSAMRTLAPALRRAGLDPVRYLDDLAERVPRLLTQGLDTGVARFQGALRDFSTADRRLVPDWMEAAAGTAATRIGALAADIRQPLQNVADEIRGAFRALAMAADDGTRRAAGNAAGGAAADGTRRGAAGGTPDGPDGPRRTPDVPDRTRPTGEIGGRPTGERTRVSPRQDAEVQRSLHGENAAADTLAARGYRVEQNPPSPPNSNRRPDYLLEGHYADAYSPSGTTSPRNIFSYIRDEKVNPPSGDRQADRIVLNLDGWQGSMDALRDQFTRWPMDGLREVLVVRGGQVSNLTLAR